MSTFKHGNGALKKGGEKRTSPYRPRFLVVALVVVVSVVVVVVVVVCKSDTLCAVLRYRILLDWKSKRADESLKGPSPFRSEPFYNIV